MKIFMGFKEIYPDDQYKEKLGAMDDQQVIEQANLLSRCAMGTPVFDGAREADVVR